MVRYAPEYFGLVSLTKLLQRHRNALFCFSHLKNRTKTFNSKVEESFMQKCPKTIPRGIAASAIGLPYCLLKK